MPVIQTHRMTFIMDKSTLSKLTELCRRDGISKCAKLRQLVNTCAMMEINLAPHCANGHRCSCPQMHGVAPSASTLDTPRAMG